MHRLRQGETTHTCSTCRLRTPLSECSHVNLGAITALADTLLFDACARYRNSSVICLACAWYELDDEEVSAEEQY